MSLFDSLRSARDYLLWPKPIATMPSFSSLPEGMENDPSKPAINLLKGSPNHALLPIDLVKEAAASTLSDPSIAIPGFGYGPDEGSELARKAIAEWLTSFYKPSKSIDADRICITGGASQNLGLMLNVYTDPEFTRNIWLVAPAYMLVFRVFEDAGFGERLRAVPEDEAGIDIAYLRKEIEKSEAGNLPTAPRYKPKRDRAKVYKHVVYCVPTFSNPSSRTMTLHRRRELVRLARDFDVLVVCDDVYDMLKWPSSITPSPETKLETAKPAHIPRLVDIDRELDGGAERKDADGFGNVVSNGTFSKLAGPGLRSGWIEGTVKFSYGVSQAGIQASGGAPSHLTSLYLARMLQTGKLQRHIQDVLLPAYASRHKMMFDAIKQHLAPLGFTIPQPDRDVVGGYFVWLTLPEGLWAEELTQRCREEERVIIAPGRVFQVPGDQESASFLHSIRLCFAFEDVDKLSEGVRRIADATRRMSSKGDDHNGSEFVMVERRDGEPDLHAYM